MDLMQELVPTQEITLTPPSATTDPSAYVEPTPMLWVDFSWTGNIRWRAGLNRSDLHEGEALIRLGEHQTQRANDAARIAELEAERAAIYDALGIGAHAHPASTLLANLKHLTGLQPLGSAGAHKQDVESEYLVVDPTDNHHICYTTNDLTKAHQWAEGALKVYGPVGLIVAAQPAS